MHAHTERERACPGSLLPVTLCTLMMLHSKLSYIRTLDLALQLLHSHRFARTKETTTRDVHTKSCRGLTSLLPHILHFFEQLPISVREEHLREELGTLLLSMSSVEEYCDCLLSKRDISSHHRINM